MASSASCANVDRMAVGGHQTEDIMPYLIRAATRIGRTIAIALVVAGSALTAGVIESAADTREINIGGVNLNAYCQKTFGAGFKSVLIGTTAGDWTCERSAGNRRPISVKDACTMQYGKAGLKARALKWSDATSWRCFQTVSVPPPPVQKGVNLNNYCVKTFGSSFKSVLIGKTAGDWTCERSAGDRRPISVKDACVMQYGNAVKQAKALDWNNPLSWVCVL